MENKIKTYREFEEYLTSLPKNFTDFESLGVPAWIIDKYFSTAIVGERSDRINPKLNKNLEGELK